MLSHYLTSAYRNLAKSPLYTALNLIGLAIGLAACILILLFVQGEFSFDRWIPDSSRIYRVHSKFDIPGREPMISTEAPGPTLRAMKDYFPEVETGARIYVRRPRVKRDDKVFFDRIYLVDPQFFDVFPVRFIEGGPDQALSDTSSVILSQSMAKKYFGDEAALGQTLSIDDNVRDREFKVTGVIEDTPRASHLQWDLIARFEEQEFKEQPWVAEQWTSVNMSIYVKLKPGADADALAARLPEFEKKNIPDMSVGGQTFAVHEFLTLSVMPVLDLHLHSVDQSQRHSRYGAVMTFAAVAFLILVIACINFMNLATARASQRAREVAMRKVLGASRPELIAQFLGESVLVALASLVVAIALVELALPTYNDFLERELSIVFWGADSILPWLFGLVVVVGVIGGLYPAVYLSRFMPAQVLKANKSSDTKGSPRLRSALVVIQFAISIALMICTAIVYGQYHYSQNKDLGFEKSDLVVVRGLARHAAAQVSEVLKTEIAKLPDVIGVTRSSDVPGGLSENNIPVQRPGEQASEPIVLGRIGVDWEFFDTYKIQLLAGRFLDERHTTDSATPDEPAEGGRAISIVVNNKAVGRLGFESPQAAIGQPLKMTNIADLRSAYLDARIVGVIRDFHYKSIREEIRPTLYLRDKQSFGELSVRVAPGAGTKVMPELERIWKAHVPTLPFNGEILADSLKELYRDEQARAQMFGAFALLAVIIACLGLYGLASFTAARRTKEIGIRKVLGASDLDIVRLLVWQFSKPVLIANLVAWPIAAYLMQDWLRSFQFRIGLEPTTFFAAGGLALAIAWVTVGGHALRVARTRPSYALRYE